MSDYHDVKLRQDETTELFDIHFENGDFELEDTFDSALNISLFADARADVSEVPQPERRRGFWGDIVLFNTEQFDINTGSKLWLVQGRLTNFELNKAIDYCRNALQWLISTGDAKEVKVDGSFSTNGIIIDVNVIIDNNRIESLSFKLWENGVAELI